MRLILPDITKMHPKLKGDPVDYPKFGSLAFQRAGHASPLDSKVDHDGAESSCVVEWQHQDTGLFGILDQNRVTEEGAEAVALVYSNVKADWVVHRRLRRGEFGDWLLRNERGWLALEVSGSADGSPTARLNEKKTQLQRCTLPVDKLAVVVGFAQPVILAGTV